MRYCIAILLVLATTAEAEPLRIVSWNVESDGNDPAVIARQLVELGRFDIYTLQEVHSRNIGRYGNAIRDGIGESYRYFASNTGRNDRLMIIFDSDRPQMDESRELFRHGDSRLNDWRHRSPMVAQFQDKQTGQRFLFLTVHLARGDAKLRTEQATGLREWAEVQRQPIIAIGDFNMDYDFPTKKGNKAFNAFLANGSGWHWVKPDPLVDTNWSDRDGDGVDNYPDSMLDFAFMYGLDGAEAESSVIVRDGDFPDDETTADHRPVSLEIELPPT